MTINRNIFSIVLAFGLACSVCFAAGSDEVSAGAETVLGKEMKPEKPDAAEEKTDSRIRDADTKKTASSTQKKTASEEKIEDYYFTEDEVSQKSGSDTQDNIGGVMFRMVMYLFVFVALIIGILVMLKRFKPASRAIYGNPAVRVLGRTPLWGKNNMFLVRVGTGRILLLSATMDKVEVLAEITDENEISELTMMAEPDKENSFFDRMLSKASLVYESGTGKSEKKGLDKIDAQVDKMKDKIERLRREKR